MMSLGLLAGLATAATDADRPRLTVLDLTVSAGVDRELASSLSEAITIEASRIGAFEVTSQKALATLLGMERQKQLLGCAEEASACAIELAEAVGSRFVLTGSLVKLGSTWQLNLQMLDARRSAPVGRTTRLATDLDTIRAQLPWAVAEATGTPPPQSPSRLVPYALMIGGGVAVATSGVLFLQSFSREETTLAELQVSGATLKDVATYQAEARAISELRVAAAVVAGLGAAAFVTGLVLNPRNDAVTRVAVVPTTNGAAVVGVFP